MRTKYGVLFVFVYIIRIVAARHTDQISKILGNINLSNDKKPLIVFVNTKKEAESTKNEVNDFNKRYVTGDNDDSDLYEDEAKYLLYNYLLRTGSGSKEALRKAIKKQCQAKVKCEKKCENNEKKNKDKYCPVNCKAVFDSLNLCDPPENKNKKESIDKKTNCDDEDQSKCEDDDWEKDGDCGDDGGCDEEEDEDDCGKKDENKCGTKRGRTMPPKWRF